MDTGKVYQDSDGNDCSIVQMVSREPYWAANRVQEGEKAIEQLATLKRQRDMLLGAMNTFTPAIDRVLWIALNWNDHNFDHEVIRKKAREAAGALGIPDSDCGMNPSKERERLFNMWNEAIAAVEGEK